MLNQTKHESSSKKRKKEDCKGQQAFLTDITGGLAELEMFRNEIRAHVLYEFAEFESKRGDYGE